jgi:putative membrane protein
MPELLAPSMRKNDKGAKALILVVSAVVFVAVVLLKKIEITANLGFDVHVFATVNAVINTIVSILLVAALIAVKKGKYQMHKSLMMLAIAFSVLFLLSYIAHHLLAGNTPFGGQGSIRYVYFFILITHIFLAAVILPFILFTAYRGLTGEWPRHRKLAKITWPIWFYVSVTGVIVYLMISPYYS